MINETKRNQIIAELIANPLESDTVIAEKCIVSRGVVKKIRLEKGLWTERRVRAVRGKEHVYRVPKPKTLSESQYLSTDEMQLSTSFLKRLINLKKNPKAKECWDLINDVLRVSENSL